MGAISLTRWYLPLTIGNSDMMMALRKMSFPRILSEVSVPVRELGTSQIIAVHPIPAARLLASSDCRCYLWRHRMSLAASRLGRRHGCRVSFGIVECGRCLRSRSFVLVQSLKLVVAVAGLLFCLALSLSLSKPTLTAIAMVTRVSWRPLVFGQRHRVFRFVGPCVLFLVWSFSYCSFFFSSSLPFLLLFYRFSRSATSMLTRPSLQARSGCR